MITRRSPAGQQSALSAWLLISTLALGCGPGRQLSPSSPYLGTLAATCASASGDANVAEPELAVSYADAWHEGWLASPLVVDLDGDGQVEVIGAREGRLVIWRGAGQRQNSLPVNGRIWASPIAAELRRDLAGLELVAAARGKVYAWSAGGQPLAGFPYSFRDEIRAIAAADLDGDGDDEIVAATTNPLKADRQRDLLVALAGDGSVVSGFPPNTSGSGGCQRDCWVVGGFDQNLAIGDLDGDGRPEIVAPHDNAYISVHHHDGVLVDVAAGAYDGVTKWPGIRFLHDLAEARTGWSEHEASANQAHFTNSAPAIADIDGNGKRELIVLGSVQNAAQSDRTRGVALWVMQSDGRRAPAWQTPLHIPEYLAGLWDYEDTNIVAATNQVTVADLLPESGQELLFAGFDGKIHCVAADRRELWSYRYTSSDRVLTGGVVVADLSGDGRPEVVFASYSPDNGQGQLFVLDAAGQLLHKVALPDRGVMSVPTIADVDGDKRPEIVVALKDGDEGKPHLLAYRVSTARDNCLLWPTGRANALRNGSLP
ncbi:MAG: VCBS repeat-containing protein [Deltaproteobacteria bacterium]|nr:VCBS repeat-containing protein [Deltaproteobacteria bacterium]